MRKSVDLSGNTGRWLNRAEIKPAMPENRCQHDQRNAVDYDVQHLLQRGMAQCRRIGDGTAHRQE